MSNRNNRMVRNSAKSITSEKETARQRAQNIQSSCLTAQALARAREQREKVESIFNAFIIVIKNRISLFMSVLFLTQVKHTRKNHTCQRVLVLRSLLVE